MKKFSFVLLVLLLVLIMIPQASVAESFNAIQEPCRSLNSLLEDFEDMPATTSTTDENVIGKFANWSFTNCGVRAPGSGNATGSHSVMMKLPSLFYTTTPVHLNVSGVQFIVYNPSSYAAKYRFEYSVKDGVWVTALSDDGEESVTAAAYTSTYCHWTLDLKSSQSAYFRIYKISGNKNAVTYVDDFQIEYTEEAPSTFTVNGVSFTMIPVEGGTFMMGATAEQGDDFHPIEKPVHQVTLSSYRIGKTEVTQALWQAVMGTNPSHYAGNLNRPVECVSWIDCQTFITKLNQMTGKYFRLPTEAEWEFAARGGNRSNGFKYSGSNTIDEVAWYKDDLPSQNYGTEGYGTQIVATKKPNELGLYDMSGNVMEYCQDWLKAYSAEAQTNPTGPELGESRVTRGGCWLSDTSRCRVSSRGGYPVDITENPLAGLRLAMSLDTPDDPVVPGSRTAYAVVDGNELTFYYDDQQETRTGTVYPIDGALTQCPWMSITKATFDISFADYYPTSTAHWFDGCYNLTEIAGIENLKTSQVTDMSFMFSSCSRLTTLDVSDFITENVTNMSAMFSGLYVDKLDISCFDTKNVTDMNNMFRCIQVSTLDVSGFDVSKVTNMDWMFAESMVATIYCDNDWSNCSATSREMFGGCYYLVGGNGTMARIVNVSDKSYARPDRSGNPGYFTAYYTQPVDNGQLQAYTVLYNDVMTFYYDDQMSHRVGKKFSIAAHVGLTMPNWFGSRRSITRAQFDASFANYRPTSTACWFYDCPNLISIDSIHNLNTSEVTSMLGMFRFCRKLTSIDVTGFNTEKVTDMSYMFCYCEGLTDLDVSNFVTDNVVNMLHMFHTCPLPSLDLTNFNTAKVTQMNTMFTSCKRLVSVYVSDLWATDNVRDGGQGMFTNCNVIVGSMGTTYNKNHLGVEYAHIDGGAPNPGYLSGPINLGDPEPYVVLSDSTLTFYFDAFKKWREGTKYQIEDKDSVTLAPLWCGDGYNKAVFDSTFVDYEPTNTSRWFFKSSSMRTIEGMEFLNTQRVTDMNRMFFYCSALIEIDLSGFNTDLVEDMSGMFYKCTALQSIDVSQFNTINVIDMAAMFGYCSSLQSLNLSSFKTGRVTNMREMFYYCSKLVSLDLSIFNTSNVLDMQAMFWNCQSLASLDVSSFNTSRVTNMGLMFSGCRSLSALNVRHFNTSSVTDMGEMFSNCYKLLNLDVTGFNTSRVTNMHGMFASCSSLTNLDVTGFNTASVTDMGVMFAYCSSLSTIDVTGFNTSNVTNMGDGGYFINIFSGNLVSHWWAGGMFSHCTSLSSLDLSHFDTSKVTNMRYMFADHESLESLDLSSFDTRNVTDMYAMFMAFGGNSLKSIDVSSFNTSNCTDMGNMFCYCHRLSSLDVKNFNTSKVTNMGAMFSYCTSLCALDLTNFDTSQVTDMRSMFSGCSSLSSIDLTNFNTTLVTDISDMFYECSSLKFIDLSSFDVSNVTKIYGMFEYCDSIETIFVNNKWSLGSVTSGSSVFYRCKSLVGGAGTVYNSSYTDYTYAHVDGGVSNPGYFTLKTLDGDVDCDGKVNINDVTVLINLLLSGNQVDINGEPDVDGDGRVSISDVTTLIDMLLAGSHP